MVLAKFASPLPLSESHAVQEADVHWELGDGFNRIRMAVPLFSFALFQLFSNVVRAVKFNMQTSNGVTETSLDELLTAKENGIDSASDLLEAAITRFYEEYEYVPDDLADLLLSVSTPTSLSIARKTLANWADKNGIGHYDIDLWDLPESDEECKKHPWKLRNCLRFYCKHNLDIESCVKTLEDLQRVNSEIKKKLAAITPASEKVPKTHWKHRWLRWREHVSKHGTPSPKSLS